MRRQSEVCNKPSFDSTENFPLPLKKSKLIKYSYSISQKNQEIMFSNLNNLKPNKNKLSSIIKSHDVKTSRNSEKENVLSIITAHNNSKMNKGYSNNPKTKFSFPITLNLNI